MAFLNDLDTDRDNVFLNTVEFGKSVSYRVASTDTSSTIIATLQNESNTSGSLDSEFAKGVLATVSAGDVTPVKGDEITWGGIIYTVQFFRLVENMYELDCTAPEDIT